MGSRRQPRTVEGAGRVGIAGKRKFYCPPTRAISDIKLTALDHRVLGAVAIHDGMSKPKGKGSGCYASYERLTGIVGCDYTNFGKAVSRLIRLGYLSREPQLLDKRKFALFVIYDTEDSWRARQLSDGEKVGEMTNDHTEIVGSAKSETRENLPETTEHYISLNEELDSVETEEIDSAKQRDFASRPIAEKLNGKPYCEQLAIFEREWKADPERFDSVADEWVQWAADIAEAIDGEEPDTSMRAQRLSEDIDARIEESAPAEAEAQPEPESHWLGRQVPDADAFHNPYPDDRIRERIVQIWKSTRDEASRLCVAKHCGKPVQEIDEFCMGAIEFSQPDKMRVREACLSFEGL